MDIGRERSAMRAFEEALDWPIDERDARLADDLRDDPALLETVRAMIRAEQGASHLLPTALPTGEARPPDDDVLPDRIGAYRVVRILGRGGMGTVYLGARSDGLFDQQVAIKVLRNGLFSARALAQFATERQILATLHHPHIAQLLDGGAAESGASYIIMELLDGLPITEHADSLALTLAARLDLFCEACGAIDHAHRNLIVHSDIKPSNVIVVDGFGVKLLDFGIARMLSQSEAMGHTPGFASPAQIAGLPATPADDIFALGVLLDALIGTTPGVDADLRAIVEKARTATSERRYGSVRDLVDDIARWRLHKPVSARPGDRWHDYALYLRRNRLPIAILVGAFLLLAVTAVATTILYIRAERARTAAEQRFEQTRSLSRYLIDDVTRALAPLPGSGPVRQQIAQRANRTLEDLSRVPGASPQLRIESAEAYSRVGAILAAADQHGDTDPDAAGIALGHAEAELRRLVPTMPNDDDLKLALARVQIERARFLEQSRNNPAGALRLLDTVDRRLAGLVRDHPRTSSVYGAQWDAQLARATVRDDQGDFAENVRRLQPVLARFAPLPLRHDADRALRLERTWTLLAGAQWYLGDLDAALRSYRNGLSALAQPGLSTDARVTAREAYAAFNISSTYTSLHRPDDALAAIEEAADAIARLRIFDGSPAVRNIENIVLLEKATDLAALRRFDRAILFGQRSLAGRRALAALQPGSYAAVRSVPVGLRPLAEIYGAAGRHRESCGLLAAADRSWADIAARRALSRFDTSDERALVDRLRSKARCEP